jgi:hypothetical protein
VVGQHVFDQHGDEGFVLDEENAEAVEGRWCQNLLP